MEKLVLKMVRVLIFMTLLVMGGVRGEGLEAIADRVIKKIGRDE